MPVQTPKKPFHQEVADKLIEQIQAGTAPWQKPWVPGQSILPVNPITGKRYHGVNTLMLMMQGYDDPRWMTYNQAEKAGYQVKPDEHGTPVQYWVFTERVPKIDSATGQPELDAKGNPVKVEVELEKPKLIVSRVFNAAQIDGIPPPEISKGFDWNPQERAEEILANCGVPITHDQVDRAYYAPVLDTIHLPARNRFPDADKYYDVAMHEYAHATGHESRLNRETLVKRGEVEYAREELVAQIASFMLCAEVGIPPDLNRNAAYVGHWVKDLKDHPAEICKAAQQADRVLTYVMERERERHPERAPAEAELAGGRQTGREEPEESRENRQYIDVPYPERLEARVLGAAWDGTAKSWYIPPEADTEKLTVKWPVHNPVKTRAGLEQKQFERAAAVRDGAQDKIYINVPKAEKDAAKELGARWDRNAVSWYVPPGVNPEPLTAKWPAHTPAQQAKPEDAPDRAERVYLTVPYREKDTARAAGARWDKAEVRWYAAPGADLDKLAKWRQEERVVQEPALTPREEFAAVLAGVGAKVDGEHPVMDKKPHRIEVDGDKAGEWSGFYVLHGDGRPAGYAKNNRTQVETHFVAKGYVFDKAERKQLQDKALETLSKRSAELDALHNRTAEKLQTQLRNLSEPKTPTPYLAAKGIQIHAGAFASGQTTCIPAYNVEDQVRSMQYIQPDGIKRFAKDSRREGCFHVVGGQDALKKAPVVVIAEGYATAASVKEALGHAVVAAFDAGNLVPAAQAIRRAMPDKAIIIAGDDDRHLEAAGKQNVGREKALEAASAVDGKAVFPRFAWGEREGDPKGFTDFNDMAVKSRFGKEGVKELLGAEIEYQLARKKESKQKRKEQEKSRAGQELSRA